VPWCANIISHQGTKAQTITGITDLLNKIILKIKRFFE
jgi:hypothetical protein